MRGALSVRVPSVLQVNVSRPKIVDWNGQKVATGIFKTPVAGKVRVARLNLDGDEQADLTVHGGPDKAVYAYPIEQYEYWKNELPNRDLEWGIFGENLTVSGFDENNLCIGDQLKIGSATFAVTQPRTPCYKLGIRFGDPTIMKRFYKSGKWGFYLSVLEEGELETGDEIVVRIRDEEGVRLSDVSRCFLDSNVDFGLVSKVLKSKLAQQMKEQLADKLSRHG
jgi:MOSC domain-containing protein YiiM